MKTTVELEAWEIKAVIEALRRDRDAADIRRNRALDTGDKAAYTQARDDAADSQSMWLRLSRVGIDE